jgi:Flp pilus assembly protein TadG
MTAVLLVGLLAIAGLVVDGGGQLRAHAQATGIAQQAARAGADALNTTTLRATGTVAVDPTAATQAAQAYLAANDETGTVTLTGATTLTVTVHVHRPTVMLGLIGIRSYAATGSATANLEAGITHPQATP